MKNWLGRHGPLLIAEIGGNHEGNFDYALQLTKEAISSGVDVVKFQIYTGASIVNRRLSPDRFEHFKKFELTPQQHIRLAETVIEAGLEYMASVWDLTALDWIDPYLKSYKIGSGDLTAFPLLKEFSKRGKPIILSTGLATEVEVLESVSYIQNTNPIYRTADQFAILQCTSMYPIDDKYANLSVLGRLKQLTGLTVGYSDHTVGAEALKAAYSIGAEILEFHFTDSRENKTFRDHKVSLTVKETVELIESITKIKELLGNPIKEPTISEIENSHVMTFRRGLYLNKDLSAGTTITESDLVVLRPNYGIDARNFEKVSGRVLKRDIQQFEELSWEDLEN